MLRYTPSEYTAQPFAIPEGHINVAPLVTDVVDLSVVAGVFDGLARPVDNAKILIVT